MKSIFLLCFMIPCVLFAQNKPGTEIRIKKAKGTITLDGVIDEEDWTTADVAKNWFLNYPVDTALAPFQSEVRLTFNEHFLYLSFVCYDDESPDIINSLRRDFDYDRNDNVGINIGPYNDRLNGFFFVLTPKGIQMEGTISGGGASDDSWNIYWDNKWYSKVQRYKDKWIGEVAIPFKSFRYKDGLKEWNISFDRLDKKRNHKSSWVHTPIQFPTGTFAYSGQLIWEDPVPPAHTNISLIPFIAGRSSTQNETDPKTNEIQPGLDAKISVTPSLNLDLTVNPDFSQVEVDQQVINLTRFEFKFPERRQFFLENSDLFDRAGFPEARVFFSRRIGLVKDSSGLYRRVPIAFGARLSGSLNKNWRVSILNMQTKEKLSVGLPSQNYTVATVQRNFWHQSNFAVTYVDKETLGVGAGDSSKYFHESVFQSSIVNGQVIKKRNTYNRVIDADLELLSKGNKWSSSSFLAQSFDAFNTNKNISGGTTLQYSVRHLSANVGHSFIGKNFNAEAGYVPSHQVYPGQFNYFSTVMYKMYPKNSRIVLMGPSLSVYQTYIPGGILSDKNYTANYSFNFLNTAVLILSYNYIYQRMTNVFNPVDDTKFTNFQIGEKYYWQTVSGIYQSNTRQLLNYTVQSTYGGFYNGTNLNVNGQLNFRYQPLGNISMRFDYNDLKLPDNYGREKLFLIGPRIDLTFTDKIFLTTYVQYNKLLDNMNLNARFQWRYKPASDFFIVYTENYLPENLMSKDRALVFKLTYWFNL
ncbi:MAG TPA: DUF5916 domain-containing protein [Cyclobacteriaceae bacterium]|nr:DUF5916 domain-containing protein [Cyclobacteriaceae bacterium]